MHRPVWRTCMAALLWVAALVAHAQPVTLDVTFTLTDRDYHPLAGVPVRMVFGSDGSWQKPATGRRFVTDAQGVARLVADVVLDTRWRRRPTNFVDSLTSVPQRTDHLLIGLELPHPAGPWLYVVEVARFADGDVLLDAFDVYLPNATGAFARRAPHDGPGWRIAIANGLVLDHPGYEPWDFMLEPTDARANRWRLKLGMKQFPPPVRR